MTRAREKQREAIITKQVIRGREFSVHLLSGICLPLQGRAFLAKPDEVVFTDFQVGKTYSKKVIPSVIILVILGRLF